MAEFRYFALPMPVVLAEGQTRTLPQILNDAFGRTPAGFENLYLTYWGAADLNGYNFDHWQPASPTVHRWAVGGSDIGPGFANQRYVAPASYATSVFTAGDVIAPSGFITASTSREADNFVTNQEYTIMVVNPALMQPGAGTGAPTPASVVEAARDYAAFYGAVPNDNDCHFVAAAVAAATGAVLAPFTTQSLNPWENEAYGFWRVAYRGSDANAVADWHTKVQPGDIVRMGWIGGGYHTITVLEVNANGTLEVYDNTKPGAGGTTIGIHDYDFQSVTLPETITVFRLTTDNYFYIPGSLYAENMEGTKFNDFLTGSHGDDQLTGFIGNDKLEGGPGNDILIGGDGNDIYVNPTGDTITEAAGGAAGNADEVQSNISFSLAAIANVERLTLTLNGNINGTGNALANRIVGNSGNNILDGGAAQDTLIGGAGNDTYINPGNDVISEAAGAAGGAADSVQSNATVTALANNVERLLLTGNGAINGTGNASPNIITGNGAANQLSGLDGNDTMNGAAGNDTLIGGNGKDLLIGHTGNDTMNGGAQADTFRFAVSNTGADRIDGYEIALDRFDLTGGAFSARTEAGGNTTLTHAGGTILIAGVTGLSLSQWNARVLPAGGIAGTKQTAASSDDNSGPISAADAPFDHGLHVAGLDVSSLFARYHPADLAWL